MTFKGEGTVVYPVLRGLAPGDRVVTNGSFLIDAETRLNPVAGSIYFGGSGGKGAQGSVVTRPSTPEAELTGDATEKKVRAELAKLDSGDCVVAEAQKYCPILPKNRLGTMGPPVKLTLEGRTIFLCCASCEDKARANPQKTLAAVQELKKGTTARPTPPAPAQPTPDAGEEGKIRANLAKLDPRERPLAEEQRFCPITGERLGDPSMGEPVKALVKDQTVFFCCKGCLPTAREDADKTLAKVKELKSKNQTGTHRH